MVLFVVAADEGWKPQSEEHLQILEVLGVDDAVVALTKTDLVDDQTAAAREDEVRSRLEGTRLAAAPIVGVSSRTGAGLDRIRAALDAMLAAAPAPVVGERPRMFVDRVFTMHGSGTVVTGTLTGGELRVGQEAELLPSSHRARIRGMQTHRRLIGTARPVSRVAVNLTGAEREGQERGDVLTLPGRWRPSVAFEGWLTPVRGLEHPITPRGAYKIHAGSAERDARIRVYGSDAVRPGDGAYVRITVERPLVIDVGDAFVLREAGRRETVAGGTVLEPFAPKRPGRDPTARLRARQGVDRATLAGRVVADRGAIRSQDLELEVGVAPAAATGYGAIVLGAWLADPSFVGARERFVVGHLRAFHDARPLREGMDIADVRAALASHGGALGDPGLAEAIIEHLVEAGSAVRAGTVLRLPEHRARTEELPDAERLVAVVSEGEPTAPTIKELIERGFAPDLIRAVCADGRLVRVSPAIVVTPELLARAEELVRERARPPEGLTVSAFREALGTSRKYALPVLEHFDHRGLTRRQGDVRMLRNRMA
jgi:selenocysteine-specific elongation factor